MVDSEWRVGDSSTPGVRLAEAVLAVVHEDADRLGWLRAGAASTVAESPDDPEAARRFQTVLELAYLVASADGFADAERVSLAALLERMTSAAVDHATLELHFRDLDDAVALLGRRERLARASADVDGPTQGEEVIGLVATVALADGHISGPEYDALVELGRHIGVGAARVRALVGSAAKRVGAQLR